MTIFFDQFKMRALFYNCPIFEYNNSVGISNGIEPVSNKNNEFNKTYLAFAQGVIFQMALNCSCIE